MGLQTAELLENITDNARFERLATLVLRITDHRFSAIMHLGVNARGQPITAPNDGFCQVPGVDPPQFLWVQHTIEHRSRLRKKWLSESEEEPGDLIKADREANELRKVFPSGKFIIILSTNQRLPTEKKNRSLARDVYSSAKRKGIEAIIWEQSRYRDFLDIHPEGQWLRREFFGIDSERLSVPLLSFLSHKSLAEYEQQQYTSPKIWISRLRNEWIGFQSDGEPHYVKFILGDSGFGKSAISYQFLQRHIEAGGYGIYIPDYIVERAISLEEAVRQTIHQLYPSLHPDEVGKIPTFISSESPYLIIVDDINRANNPSELIRKLVDWSCNPYLIVCPVLSRYWNLSKSLEIKAKVDVISIERMVMDEAIEAVHNVVMSAGRSVTAIDARKIAGRLRCDPLQIGTLGLLLEVNPDADVLVLADNVVDTYISQYISEAADASKNEFFIHEYIDAIQILTFTMLSKKNLYPHLNLLEEWFQNSPKRIRVIRDLASYGKVCKVLENGEFRFQHDRFLEHFSVSAIRPSLAEPTRHKDILGEPYYAELIGRALVKYPQPDTVLHEMIQLSPLALSFSVQEIGDPVSDYHQKIIQIVKNWVAYSGDDFYTPEALRGAVANCFINTDSPAVLDIVQSNFGLEVSWLGEIARLRNGDFASGVKFFTFVGTEYLHDNFYTELVEHAKRYHGEGLRTELLKTLSAPIDERLYKGTIVLAGYLGFQGLQEAIVTKWRQQPNRAKHLDITIWAIYRSEELEKQKVYLDELIQYWADMPDILLEDRDNYRQHIAEELTRLFSPKADENLAQYLIELIRQRPQLEKAVSYICGRIDRPQAIEYAVQQAANQEDWYRSSSLTYWSSFQNPRLSQVSLSVLQELWESDSNKDAARQVAFQLWLKNVDRENFDILPIIQAITPLSPLYISSLQERALLSDRTCVPALLSQLDTHPVLYYVLPPVWDESFKQAVSKRLISFVENIPVDFSGGVLDEHYMLASILTQIPISDAEELLFKHWNHLRYSRLFLQAAVFVGTPKTLALVDEVICDYPSEFDPFKYLDFTYGFTFYSHEKHLTPQHLSHLESYLERLNRDEQNSCADYCYRRGGEFIKWCVTHLSQEINDIYRSRYDPTDDDILRQLEFNYGHLRNHTLDLLKRYLKKNNPAKFIDILRRWLQDKPTWQKVEAAAACLEVIGSRPDIAILDVPLENDWENYHVRVLKESAMFGICRRTLT
jgi:hypothetical protein